LTTRLKKSGVEGSRVIIVAHDGDEHADAVSNCLADLGVTFLRTSRAALPAATFVWRPADQLQSGGDMIGQCAGFWRRPGRTDVSAIEAEYASFIDRECEDAFDGSLLVADIAWLSAPSVVRTAELKISQLAAAERLGLTYPPTLVTNSADAAAEFTRQYPSVIAKPVRYGLLSLRAPARIAWTSRTSPSELATLSGSPIVLQAEIAAALHLRIVTVDDRVFASSLDARELDWRSKLENHSRFKMFRGERAESIGASALILAQALGLGYTSQDWILDANGDAWFLDANPSGQWLFADPVHDGAITSAIAAALVVRADSRS
jgi:hypothetical protein